MELEINGIKFKADIRKAADLKPVLAFPEALKEDFDAYYMFRDIYYSKKDHRKILDLDLRFDYTVIPPNNIGGEPIKTYGHYHPEAVKGLTYPELYQVVGGRAIFLLQRRENGRIVEVLAVNAKEGDAVIVPPNFGHVTINPSDEYLITTNWVCRSFSSIYEPYTKLRGACYYYIGGKWVKNEKYGVVPEIEFAKPNDILDVRGDDMYNLIEETEKLYFLVAPQRCRDIFSNALEKLK
jgi:glucose-6-phosphate isomerase